MSNYIFVVASPRHAPAVAAFLTEDVSSDEMLPGGVRAMWAAPDGVVPTGFFRGYAIDHEGERLLFTGAAEVPSPRDPLEGCYVTVRRSPTEFEVGADIFGQMSLLYFTAPGIVAVSDSMLALSELRKNLGLPCTLNNEVVRSRLWMNAMADQQLSEGTVVREISYATPGTLLKVNAEDIALTVKRPSFRDLFSSGLTTYEDTVSEAALRMVRLTKTVAGLGSNVVLSLSGGMDSRVCLAAIVAAGAQNTVRMGSSAEPGRERDFEVATLLSERFGFALNEKPTVSSAPIKRLDRLTLWADACMGIYDPLHAPPGVYTDRPHFPVSGHGAELLKGNYGWRRIRAIGKTNDFGVWEQCELALAAMGIDPADKWGSEWHYLGFRNAIHSGRSTMNALLGARPISQRKLVALSRSELNQFPAPKKGERSIVADLLMLLSPELAATPFDVPAKDMTADEVSTRLKILGGPVDAGSAKAYRVHGKPLPATGPLPSIMARAKARGFYGGMTPARIIDLMREFSPKGTEAHRLLADESAKGLTEPIRASSRAAAGAGKVLALSLAD